MQSKREDDNDAALHFRADRISRINGLYYFSTREGTMEGPYKTKEDALAGIEDYIARMTGKYTHLLNLPSFTLKD